MDLKAEVEHQEVSSDKSSDPEKLVTRDGGPSIVLGGAEERKLVRKLDFHIIPFVMLTYTLSFLDRYEDSFPSKSPVISEEANTSARVNIGNARLYVSTKPYIPIQREIANSASRI